MYQRNQFVPRQFIQHTPTHQHGVVYPNPVQEYNLIATPITVIDPTNEAVVYTDTQEGSAMRFVLLQDDYLPMVEVYTASKLTTLKELAVAREKLLAAYKSEQASILRRVAEAKVSRSEVNFSKINDFDGVVKTLEKLNVRIRETIHNVELVGVSKSVGYEGSEQVLQVAAQFRNKIDGVVTTVRAIKGPHFTPMIDSRSFCGINGVSDHCSRAYDPNSHKTLVNPIAPTDYVNALQKSYAARPTTLKDVDLKSWVICNVFGISVRTDRPIQFSEFFTVGVRCMLEDILNNELMEKLEAGYKYPGNVVDDFLQEFNIFRFDPHTLSRNISEIVHITLRFQENPTHYQWLKETIGFDLNTPDAEKALLRAVIELLK